MTESDDPRVAELRELFTRGRIDAVLARCHALLSESPGAPRILEILGLALLRAGRSAEAVAVLERAQRLAPDDTQINYNLAVTYQENGDSARAMLRYSDCLRADPNHADALWNHGELLRVNGYFEAARDCFQRILDNGGRRRDIDHRLAVCHAHLRDDEAADAAFRRALDGNSTDASLTHWEYAHFLLGLGRFAKGWEHYDHRFEAGAKTSVQCHPFSMPAWEGQPLAGKHLLVHGEQGLGDEIMFCAVVPELMREAARVTIACQPPLVRLFAESFPDCTVLPHRARTAPATVDDGDGIDFAVAMGSLGRWRRREFTDFANSAKGYLRATAFDCRRFAHLLERVAPQGEKQLKVGLMWGSNPARGVEWGRRRAMRKSIPAALLETLAGREYVLFVSLQNRDNGAEAAWAPGLDIIDLQDHLLDLADTAALIANLDLVISVDTSVAHLAGAMGVPVWILLMHTCDWRWGWDSITTPWYDSARLFRQPTEGDWASVLAAVSDALADFDPRATRGSVTDGEVDAETDVGAVRLQAE
jgi:Flp pilus assembly protein TadD